MVPARPSVCYASGNTGEKLYAIIQRRAARRIWWPKSALQELTFRLRFPGAQEKEGEPKPALFHVPSVVIAMTEHFIIAEAATARQYVAGAVIRIERLSKCRRRDDGQHSQDG